MDTLKSGHLASSGHSVLSLCNRAMYQDILFNQDTRFCPNAILIGISLFNQDTLFCPNAIEQCINQDTLYCPNAIEQCINQDTLFNQDTLLRPNAIEITPLQDIPPIRTLFLGPKSVHIWGGSHYDGLVLRIARFDLRKTQVNVILAPKD